MKTIGLLGGMGWGNTQTHYFLINREINEGLGGFHSAKIILVSVMLDPIHPSVSPCLQIGIDRSNEIFTRFSGLSYWYNTRILRLMNVRLG